MTDRDDDYPQPEYDENGARVWRFSGHEEDGAGLMAICEDLFPMLKAHFEARADLDASIRQLEGNDIE